MYLILEAYSTVEMIRLVTEHLAKGYVCQGGICTTSENNDYSEKFYQAMITKETVYVKNAF